MLIKRGLWTLWTAVHVIGVMGNQFVCLGDRTIAAEGLSATCRVRRRCQDRPRNGGATLTQVARGRLPLTVGNR